MHDFCSVEGATVTHICHTYDSIFLSVLLNDAINCWDYIATG